MSEYRAAIGRFACLAISSTFPLRRRCKKPKLEGGENPIITTKSTNLKGSSGSLDRYKRRNKRYEVGQRSKSLNERREGRSRIRKPQLPRARSQSLSRGRKGKQNVISDHFKNACVACKTDLFDQRWERGRSTKTLRQSRQEPKQESCCSHPGKDDGIEGSQLKFFTCVECLILERAMIAVIQMLLVRSGIETNPGPTNGDDSPCCNASQHFNRVKNTIVKAQNNFQSKVTPDTLSKKVIEIEETGNGLIFILFLIANVYTSM